MNWLPAHCRGCGTRVYLVHVRWCEKRQWKYSTTYPEHVCRGAR